MWKKGGYVVDSQSPEKQLKKLEQRQSEQKIAKKIVLIATAIIVTLVLIVGIWGYFYVQGALKPVDTESDKSVKIEVPIGSSIDTIAATLEDKGIIKNAKIFKYYTKFNNSAGFQAGTYNLSPSMTIEEIIKSLKTGKIYRTPEFTLTVPEGLTIDQIADRVAKNTNYSKEQFMDLVTSKEFIKKMKEQFPDTVTKAVNDKDIRYALEGYLYPATYAFYEKEPSLETIATDMVKQTDTVVQQYLPTLKEKNMSVHDFLTFASLLEREATASTDRETIASVFNNRIEKDMPLQTDPTVLYALGKHKNRVLYKDLKVDNPYNTYTNKGLPPGPIANAGIESLKATIDPATTEYIYFVADKDGQNHFAKTYAEHQKNVAKYIK
nr:endolytic transglycosylase MltG [Kurthia huakuii]